MVISFYHQSEATLWVYESVLGWIDILEEHTGPLKAADCNVIVINVSFDKCVSCIWKRRHGRSNECVVKSNRVLDFDNWFSLVLTVFCWWILNVVWTMVSLRISPRLWKMSRDAGRQRSSIFNPSSARFVGFAQILCEKKVAKKNAGQMSQLGEGGIQRGGKSKKYSGGKKIK
jgi:hypothetical protein